jgi:hypothetical protein
MGPEDNIKKLAKKKVLKEIAKTRNELLKTLNRGKYSPNIKKVEISDTEKERKKKKLALTEKQEELLSTKMKGEKREIENTLFRLKEKTKTLKDSFLEESEKDAMKIAKVYIEELNSNEFWSSQFQKTKNEISLKQIIDEIKGKN